MMPKLYESNELLFESNGIGILSDAISCTVTEELNGAFELQLEYPVGGIFSEELQVERIVFVQPNPYTNAQPFRIYEVDKLLSQISVRAAHISYDLANYFCTVNTLSGKITLGELKESFWEPTINGFLPFSINIFGDENKEIRLQSPPRSERSILMDLTKQGCDVKFDGFNINIYTYKTGTNTGFKILYGTNLTDYSNTLSLDGAYTHIFPYALQSVELMSDEMPTGEVAHEMLLLPEVVVETGFSSHTRRIFPLDLSSTFTTVGESFDRMSDKYKQFVFQEMRRAAIQEALLHKDPQIQYSVGFASARGSTDKTLEQLEKVVVSDVILLEVPQFGVTVEQRCTRTNYDCLRSRYLSADFNQNQKGIEDAILENKKRIGANENAITQQAYYANRTFQPKS